MAEQPAPAEAAPAPAGAEILVLVAHPELEQSRANRRMLLAARSLQAVGPPGRIEVRDLYALYPDYLIDVADEQAALAAAKLVVWQQPLHWYGMPPLLKLWLDDVLAFGWAYGPGGTAVRGKDLWLVATTGGPEDSYRPDSYNRYFFDAFLPPYEQTAALCGMRFLPPLTLHGAHKASEAELAAHAELYAAKLAAIPTGRRSSRSSRASSASCPLTARPIENVMESV
jgi:glutathione-regulated potassium-efflux system ancillary protein KefF